MTNVEKLDELGILGDIRQRMGANDIFDNLYDNDINEMTHDDILKAWSGWRLGDPSWWSTMKSYFDRLEDLKSRDHLEIWDKEEI